MSATAPCGHATPSSTGSTSPPLIDFPLDEIRPVDPPGFEPVMSRAQKTQPTFIVVEKDGERSHVVDLEPGS